jgi:hypothetical protein
MSLQVDPPFGLGQTWFSLGSGESIKNDSYHGLQSAAAYGDNFTGVVKEFTDVNPVTGQVRTNRRKVCVAVKNTSAIPLLPKRVVRFSLTAGKVLTEVDGYSAALNEERVGVVDEWLPAAGVTVNDIFWVTVDGPTEVAHALSGTNIAAGDRLAAIAAATSGATTAGRVTPNAYAGATDMAGLIGYAMSAATSGNTPLALIKTRFN